MIKILIYNDIFTSLKGTKKFKVRLNSSRNCSVWFVTSPEKEKEQFSWKTSWKLGKHGKSGWRTSKKKHCILKLQKQGSAWVPWRFSMAAKKSRNLQLTRYSASGRGLQFKEAEKETRQGKWGERRKSRKPPRPLRKQEHRAQKEKSKSCGYCGKTGTHSPGRNCPVYRKQCLKCGKYNHYASYCRVGAPRQEEKNEGTQPLRIVLDLEIPEKGNSNQCTTRSDNGHCRDISRTTQCRDTTRTGSWTNTRSRRWPTSEPTSSN